MVLDTHCASFDFAQDEANRSCHRQFIVILSEGEGRMLDVQAPTAQGSESGLTRVCAED